jgi:membrane protein implicated in regulation of membrane protease activity
MLLLLALLALIVLPEPASLIAGGVLFVLGCGEVAFWWRTVRHRRVQTGAEAIIGSDATVLSACRPDGEVWLGGARWRAHCDEGADVDDVVTVAARNRLTLIVERPRR